MSVLLDFETVAEASTLHMSPTESWVRTALHEVAKAVELEHLERQGQQPAQGAEPVVGTHRVEITFFAPVIDDAEAFYGLIEWEALAEAHGLGVVVTDIGMTPVVNDIHIAPI